MTTAAAAAVILSLDGACALVGGGASGSASERDGAGTIRLLASRPPKGKRKRHERSNAGASPLKNGRPSRRRFAATMIVMS